MAFSKWIETSHLKVLTELGSLNAYDRKTNIEEEEGIIFTPLHSKSVYVCIPFSQPHFWLVWLIKWSYSKPLTFNSKSFQIFNRMFQTINLQKMFSTTSPVNTWLCQSFYPIASTPETPITVIHAANGLRKIRRQHGRDEGEVKRPGRSGERRRASVSLQALRGFHLERDQYGSPRLTSREGMGVIYR